MTAEDVPDKINLNFLVISANVGTLFEDLEGIESGWLSEFEKLIKKYEPHFIALHCQEVGGKDYKTTIGPVNDFFKKFIDSNFLKEFTVVRGYLDCDVSRVDQYTALGSIYFVHKLVEEASIYDFKRGKFAKCNGKEIYSKEICKLANVKKEKFAQDFFPDCRWSRKGYVRVRWKICGKVVEFINVHLFHDDNNLVSIESSPSHYTAYRKRALHFVIKKLKEEHPIDQGCYFMFGDFNFRLDAKALIQNLCPDSKQQAIRSLSDEDGVVRMLYRDERVNGLKSDEDTQDGERKDKILVKIEKKSFAVDKSIFQPTSSFKMLLEFDLELSASKEDLKEFDINFPPTYPFSEDVKKPFEYMGTRCPSWCDRILLSASSWDWLRSQRSASEIVYNTIGNSTCMGDHKPVYLAFRAALEKSRKRGNDSHSYVSNDAEQTTS